MTKILIKWIIIVMCVTNFSNAREKINNLNQTHKEFGKCKHMELTIENPDINNVDEVFYAFNIQHNKQYHYYLTKCHLKIVFDDNQYNTWIKSNLFNNKTMICWKNYLEDVN